jgi:acyl carrier protein
MTALAEIETEIRSILSQMFADRDVDIAGLDRDEPLLLTLGLDSLDAVDLAMELRRRLTVEFSEADAYDASLSKLASPVLERRADR